MPRKPGCADCAPRASVARAPRSLPPSGSPPAPRRPSSGSPRWSRNWRGSTPNCRLPARRWNQARVRPRGGARHARRPRRARGRVACRAAGRGGGSCRTRGPPHRRGHARPAAPGGRRRWPRRPPRRRRVAALAPQVERAAAERAAAEAALAEAQAARGAAPDLATLRAEVDAARATLAAARRAEAEARDARAALAGEAVRIAARQETRRTIGRSARSGETRRAEAAARCEELAARHAEAEGEVTTLAEAPEAAALRRAEAARLLSEAEAGHAEAARALRAAEAELREAAAHRRDCDARFAAAREAQVRGEAAVETAEAAALAVEERIDGAPRRGPCGAADRLAELSDAAEEKARRKLDRLTREREEMGPVNLRAEHELNELDQRRDAIDAERDEVATAIAKLRGSIGHLNREGRERLRVVFDKVDARVPRPVHAPVRRRAGAPGPGRLRRSAGGGARDLCGAAGKEARLAEAALGRRAGADGAVADLRGVPLQPGAGLRAGRGGRAARRRQRGTALRPAGRMAAGTRGRGGTRFLIVTHHPLTMARMHRLYGVTMQERGVSRLLSVDLRRAVELAEGPVAG